MGKKHKDKPTENTVENQHKPWQFQPGQSGNPAGRPKGIKNAIQADYLKAMQADFMEFGIQAIRDMRERNPGRYIEAIGRLMPQEHSWDEEQAAEGWAKFAEILMNLSRSKDK